jgi:pyruvate dehydrogenase (quinone)
MAGEQGQDGRTVSDFMIERLGAWGVRRIYGYPGDGINGILAAIQRAGNRPEFIQVAHEELAGFAACAHAKWTGEVGVCLATSGPGAIHLLNGMYDAQGDHQPLVAIIGQQPRMALGGHFQQEVDLLSLCKDVAREFVQMATDAAQMRHLIDRAFRIALSERTVTCLIVPHDVQLLPAVEELPREHGAIPSGVGFRAPLVVPAEEDLRRAAGVLNAGKKVAILAGAGALGAADEVAQVADVLGAGVAKAMLGKAALPDDLPFVTGSAGWLGTGPSNRMLKGCDTLLLIGSSFPYTEYLPEEGQARGVQIEIDPRRLSIRYPMEVGLAGDSALTLRALLPFLERKADRSWREGIERETAAWWQTLDERAEHPADPLNPQLLFRELSARLPDGAILAADSGTATVWLARNIRVRRGMMASVSGRLASMGSGVPYALAAKYAHPDRLAVALVGDGAMQMSGISALIDVAKGWRRWRDPRLIVLALNNRDLSYVTWEQRAMEGEPKFSASQDLPDVPFARYAELLGLRGIRVEHPAEVAPALDEALAADRPVVIDALVDPSVPPLPPELTDKQRESLAKALAGGDPDAAAVREQLRVEGYEVGEA